MKLDVREDGHVTVISLEGDLVIGSAEESFKKRVLGLVEEGKVDLLVDLTAVPLVDSSGLGALVRALSVTQGEGGQTKLLGVGAHLKKLLELTALDSVFEMYTDREEAIGSF